MGYDTKRFIGKIADHFICSICLDVIENPVMTGICEHIFCKKYLNECILRSNS